ncbi:hypothetical protein SLT67_19375 [Paenibacillus illinoisensis]|uniref:hypothetical protein n=1 Tax=Paenibacillus illinoisensis TaxID=59845 RepID=UPI003CE69046
MKILNLNDQPIEPYDYLNTIPGGEVAEVQLPIYHGTVSGMPEGIDALIVASDLQGIVSCAPDGNAHDDSRCSGWI